MPKSNFISKHLKGVTITPKTSYEFAASLEEQVVRLLAPRYGFDQEEARKYLREIIDIKECMQSHNIRMAEILSKNIGFETNNEQMKLDNLSSASKAKNKIVNVNHEYVESSTGEPPDDVKEELTHWAKNEKRNIAIEQNSERNLPRAFCGVGDLGEALALAMYPESIGSSSKGGMAHDNKEVNPVTGEIMCAREVKFISLEGTKTCKKCAQKSPRFQKRCYYCHSTDFKLNSDSRAGLSSKAHQEWYVEKCILNEYIIFIQSYDENNETIKLVAFKFLSSNEYFCEYIKNQYENGKKKGGSCNFIPYSYDWFLSGPIKILDINIDISNENPIINTKFYNVNSTRHEMIPISLFNKNEITEYKFNAIHEKLNYDYVMSTGIKIRNKNLGKNRGKVTRK